MSVLIVTSLGDIVIDLHTGRCPLTTKNFLKLCKMKYYNGCLFHKVEKDFMAQTGDRTGTGTGGDSVYKFLYGDQARFFDDEIHPDLKHSKTGTVAMASAGKNCNASQFYFTLRDDIDYLDGKHTVFGIIEEQEGLDTLAKINEAFVDDKGRPFKNIRIKHTYILDDPFSEPAQLVEFIPEKSPEGKPDDEVAEERLEDNWVPMEETLGVSELEEALHSKEAHTNAAILESIGDIPDAEIKPPENVLFVCKLNPVTQDEDLHTIFSRFGNVVSADIIRDFKTGDSLCYAFIEFETNEACELAYLKMDNTLIDDRRIHVDFSQSVAKLWSQYRHGKRSQSQGSGCFKCGAPDHLAKNCSQESGQKQESSKYVLKENNAQHGAGRESYEMVFDGDNSTNSQSSDDETRRKKHKADNRSSEDSRHRVPVKRGPDSSYKHRHDYESRTYRGVGREMRRGEEYQSERDRELRGRDMERDRYKELHKRHESGRHGRADVEPIKRDSDLEQHRKDGRMDGDSQRKELSDHVSARHGKDDKRYGKRVRGHDNGIACDVASGEGYIERDVWKRHESSQYARNDEEPRKRSSESGRLRKDERIGGDGRRADVKDKDTAQHGTDDKDYGKRKRDRDDHINHQRSHREERR